MLSSDWALNSVLFRCVLNKPVSHLQAAVCFLLKLPWVGVCSAPGCLAATPSKEELILSVPRGISVGWSPQVAGSLSWGMPVK